jgi:ATP-binding cassette subfamily A (ABC1) protein 3
LARQIITLFQKRYTLLLQKSSWIAYGINLLIPIIIASALVKFLYRLDPLQTCEANVQVLRNSSASEAVQYAGSQAPYTVLAPLESYYPPEIYTSGDAPSAFIGPKSAFSGAVQDSLYINSLATLFQSSSSYYTGGTTPPFNATYSDAEALSTRQFVNDSTAMIAALTNSSLGSFGGFGILAPTLETAILFHDTYRYSADVHMEAFSLITNRIRNSSTNTGTARLSSTSLRTMRHIVNNVNFLNLPITLLSK